MRLVFPLIFALLSFSAASAQYHLKALDIAKQLKLLSKMIGSLLMIVGLSLLIYQTSYAQETDLPEELGTAQGIHKIHLSVEETPRAFRDIEYIYLKKKPGTNTADPPTDEAGRVFIAGELKLSGGDTFKFKTAHFVRTANGDYKGIIFETEKSHGVWYTFTGEYLENRIYDKRRGSYTTIKGTLVKHSNGTILASDELPFFEWAEL